MTNETKTFKHKLDGKVWRAVQAMVDGLKKQDARSDFQVEMGTYGGRSYYCNTNLCFGCAATSTVQEACGIDLVAEDMPNLDQAHGLVEDIDRNPESVTYTFAAQAKKLDMCDVDLTIFERAINQLRVGNITPIFHYMGYGEHDRVFGLLPELHNSDWRDRLSYYQDYANKLKELDI